LLCVKSYDLNGVLVALKNKITANTHIIPLLNGIDIYERVRKVIPNGILYPACVYIVSYIEQPGKVTQKAGGNIILGPDPEHPEVAPREILSIFDAAGISYQWRQDPEVDVWIKYLFIAPYSMVAASEDQTLGQIIKSDESSRKVKEIMNEIAAIARKSGVKLPENIVEDSFQKGRQFGYETKFSFQRDFEQKGKPNEGELFGDTIIRLGKEWGVATPVTEMVNRKLKER
jgi:2-dehydropantoate 2-reductase